MKRILVRNEYTEQSVWRDALGMTEPLLTHADHTDCLDAPDWIPAGHSGSCRSGLIIFRDSI